MGARCLPDSSSSSTARIPSRWPASGRLTDLGATFTGTLGTDGLDHYAVGMKDPEGNEFDIN
jgi:hypothetical protein